jgi:hypothetical protein
MLLFRSLCALACGVLLLSLIRIGMGQGAREEAARAGAAAPGDSSRWPAPALTDDTYSKWLAFIRPTQEELKWRKVRWHRSLSEAAREARQLQRPVLLWTMNGHPCGET